MTEEIIIDCAFYKDSVCASPINKTCEYCKNIDVSKCYYKQLKRLEQENKELQAYKDVNEDFKKAWDELNKKYTEVLKLAKENADSNEYCLQELEKENEELKKQIESQKGLITVGRKQQYDMTMAYDKLKTALEEIRIYINRCRDSHCDSNCEYWDNCKGNYNIDNILTKINEVLNP